MKHNLPMLPVHHMAAHALTARMERTDLKFPFLVKSFICVERSHLVKLCCRYFLCLGDIVSSLFVPPFMNLPYWEKLLTTVLVKRWTNVLGCLVFITYQDYEMFPEGVP